MAVPGGPWILARCEASRSHDTVHNNSTKNNNKKNRWPEASHSWAKPHSGRRPTTPSATSGGAPKWTRCDADQRKQLEHLCSITTTAATSRYITRPAIATERLKRNAAGQVVLQLKSAYQDGTTHVVMSPLEFMQRRAALVPRPRLHLIRFHGVA